MTLFGNNFNEGVKDRERDGRDRPIKNGFRQLGKIDFWLPGHNTRLQERLKGYNTASTDVARVDNISSIIPNIISKFPSDNNSTKTSDLDSQSINISSKLKVTSNTTVNVGSVLGKHMTIDELIEACTNLKNKLQSVHDDFLVIYKNCTENQESFKQERLYYSTEIEVLSEQTFIQNSAIRFAKNQQDTDQEIQKLISLLDDLMMEIINLTNQINDVDIVEIDKVIKWLENHPER